MPHRNALPPEHVDSPASTFAERQPGEVTAADVPEDERKARGVKTAAEAKEADTERLQRERAERLEREADERERKAEAERQMLRDRAEAARLHRQAMDRPAEQAQDQEQTEPAPKATSRRRAQSMT